MTPGRSGAVAGRLLALTFVLLSLMLLTGSARPSPVADGTTARASAPAVAPSEDPSSAPSAGDPGTLETLPPPPYHVTAYDIPTIPPDELPYAATRLPSKSPAPIHDGDGIPMKLVDGHRVYGPAGLAEYGLKREDAYRRVADPDYLATASQVLGKLMALGIRSDGGVYIPYGFDFPLHAIRTEMMHAPWFSAMAQGLALSLAVRLYRDTGDAAYLADADLLFDSFRHVGRGPSPWVTYVDEDGYLWLEEYPEETTPSEHTANGFNYAVFGLYDYWAETHDPTALQILRASLTTMRHYVAQYRIPGSYSKYCLRHGHPAVKYHRIVTAQLVYLYRMSGDEYFLSMSKTFARDYP